MAISTIQNFKIYEEQYYGGMNETLQQNVNVFNAASGGAMSLVTLARKGQYEQESFFQDLGANLVVRRDPTSTATVTPLGLAQSEFVGVKLNRRVGPVSVTNDAFRKIQRSPEEFSFILGQQIGPRVMGDYCDTAISAVTAAIRGVSSLVHDEQTGAGTNTMRHTYLAKVLAKFGDAASRIVAWVMHSKPFFDLMQQSITDNVFNVGGVTIVAGTVATLGKPTIITDSSALVETSGSSLSSYFTLGLVQDAVSVQQSEEREIANRLITGEENLRQEIQGEHAFNIRARGFAWDMTSGGVNPVAASIATSTNWDQVVTDVKNCAGVLLITD